jgi:hypothetical protein
MATIEWRVGIYRVKIRRKGYPTQSATFQRRADAKKWVQITEATIHERRHFPGNNAEHHTLTDLMKRCRQDALPHKRPSTICNQIHHVDWWQKQLGESCLVDIAPARLVECRDTLTKTRSNATVCIIWRHYRMCLLLPSRNGNGWRIILYAKSESPKNCLIVKILERVFSLRHSQTQGHSVFQCNTDQVQGRPRLGRETAGPCM